MRRPAGALLIVIATTAFFYVAMLSTVLRHLDPLTGDEPFYVMTAISMIRDRDLDETNNYANRDFEEFYPDDPLPENWQGWPAFPRTLPPHPAITDREGLFTKHGLGVSMLIAIPYEIAGRVGAVLIILACGVAVSGQMYLLGRESGVAERTAATAAIALAVTMPLAPYSLLLFPEIPAALLVIYAIRRTTAQTNSTLQWLACGAAIGFLPWLHQRFGVISLVLGIVLLYRLWQTRSKSTTLALVPVGVGAFSIVAYNVWLYGQVTQNTADHAGFSSVAGTLNGFAGLFLDAQWGLLVAAPVAIVAIAALPAWYRAVPDVARVAAITVAPYLLIVAAYRVWWGEWGPPARYLVPIVPLLAGPLAIWLARAKGWQHSIAVAAWLAGVILTAIGFANPRRFYHHPNGINNLYTVAGERIGIDLAGRLTPFQFYSPATVGERVAIAVLVVLAITLLAIWFERPLKRTARP